jgi:hypothetical protein
MKKRDIIKQSIKELERLIELKERILRDGLTSNMTIELGLTGDIIVIPKDIAYKINIYGLINKEITLKKEELQVLVSN